MTVTLIDDFESGADGATFTSGGNWTSVSGTPIYESDAAIHDSRGLRIENAEAAAYNFAGTTPSGSFYWTAAAVASGSNRFFAITTTFDEFGIQLRQHSNTTFSLATEANVLIGSATTMTWAIGDVFRIDWQCSFSGTAPTVTLQLSCRFFKNANIEGATPDATLTQSTVADFADSPGGQKTPARARFLTAGAGFINDFDTVRGSDVHEWIGPFLVGPLHERTVMRIVATGT